MKRILIILILFFPIIVNALDFPETYSDSLIIYDLTDDNIIYSVSENSKRSIASLTKIATTITAILNIKDLSEKVTITKEILDTVRWDASRAGLKVGDIVTYEDLLYASILPSGADATNALAISLFGSIDNMVFKMNELARSLNMNDTSFVNTTGLDAENHYSTANDVLTLLKYALSNKLFKKIYTTKEYTLTNGLVVKSTINKYPVKDETAKILGSKTGFTLDAGLCMSALFNIKEHDMLLVSLNADYNIDFANIKDAINLINFINNNYDIQKIISKDYLITNIKVINSNIDNYEVNLSNDIYKFLPNDYNKDLISINYNGLNELSYKNKIDSKIGTINCYYDNELIYSEDIYLKEDIHINIIKILMKYWYFLILIPIILIIFLIRKNSYLHN